MIKIPFEILSMKNSKEIFRKYGMKTKKLPDGTKLRFKGKVPFISNRAIVIIQKQKIIKYMRQPEVMAMWKKEIEGKTKPYILCYKLYRETIGAFDYNNISHIVFDAMQKPQKRPKREGANWIEDDDMRHLMPIACGWEKDDKNPRMEFFIANEEQKKVLEKEIFYLHNKNESDIV